MHTSAWYALHTCVLEKMDNAVVFRLTFSNLMPVSYLGSITSRIYRSTQMEGIKLGKVVLDNMITPAQISIQCTKYIGNSVQWISKLSFHLVNMQYVDVLLLRKFGCCYFTVYTLWLMTCPDSSLNHAVLFSVIWSRKTRIFF